MQKRMLLVLVVVTVTLGCAYGVPAQAQTPRSPLLYGLSSFILPGLGQLLQDEPEKAVIHFGVALAIPLAGTLAALASPFPQIVGAVTGVAALGWAFASGLDAYHLAKSYNEANGFSGVDDTNATAHAVIPWPAPV